MHDDERQSILDDDAADLALHTFSPESRTATLAGSAVHHGQGARPMPYNGERLGFALDRTVRAYRRLLHTQLEEMGLHPVQESLLTEVLYAERTLTQDDFARRLGCSRQTVARSIRRLCRAGMLETEPFPGDARQVTVRLSDLGRTVLRVTGAGLRDLEVELAEELEDEGLDFLYEALDRVAGAANRALRERRAPPAPLAAVGLRRVRMTTSENGEPTGG